ncbi:PREDICTED: uncharacterized protein LOC109193819 [Ipomoea nil]|uniref:uncharacterized protein LOC109193819 n=1 Tax=Ipomoea nil TaxID=35883 RepID=UPI0009011F64|nr:PREDICTED: uncharacterized protein LOC109193819 [Ipomoea nil]
MELIMLCVTTVTYSVTINGASGGQNAQDRGAIQGCRVARGALPISHLFFVIRQCLNVYETLSGTLRRRVGRKLLLLGVVQAPNFGKYLGLPSFVGRNKRDVFAYVEDKIRQRIGSWNKKLLSHADFGGGTGNDKGIHWKAWDRLCVPKKYGGFGFKDLRAFNLAMLGKQAWRFLTAPESLAARVYKARYFPKSTFYEASLGNCPSYCWRSIMATHGLICGGVRRRIGNGLINPDTGSWDPHILSDLFDSQEAVRISRIPVSPDYDDSWFWPNDPRGCYTVKGGYRYIIALYYIWWARNQAVWELNMPLPSVVWRRAVSALASWKLVRQKDH